MSSCLSGGGRAYRLDLDLIKSPTTSWTSHSSSPSSTLSESSNSPIAIFTRKPRTPRKRPNQTYNEAAALLSTAYPKIFSTKHLTKPCKFTKQQYPFSYESSDLLLPFPVIDNSSFLIHHHHHHHHPPVLEKPNYPVEQKQSNSCEKPCQSPGEINSKVDFLEFCDEFNEDFDAESILDEEIEEGIDSIMGDSSVENHATIDESNAYQIGTCYGYPVGLGFGVNLEYGYGMMRNSIRGAFRNADEGDWWRFPSVNVCDITPKFHKPPKEKKKKKVEKAVELKNSEQPSSAKENAMSSRANKDNSPEKLVKLEPDEPKPNVGLLLKLNYDDVLKEWSDGPLPFSDDSPVAEASGNDVQVCFLSLPPGKLVVQSGF